MSNVGQNNRDQKRMTRRGALEAWASFYCGYYRPGNPKRVVYFEIGAARRPATVTFRVNHLEPSVPSESLEVAPSRKVVVESEESDMKALSEKILEEMKTVRMSNGSTRTFAFPPSIYDTFYAETYRIVFTIDDQYRLTGHIKPYQSKSKLGQSFKAALAL